MTELLTKFGLHPEQASTMAPRVDALYGFLVALSAFFSLLIAGLIVVFAYRFRRRKHQPYTPKMGKPIVGSWVLELTWTIIPFLIAMGIFSWSASIYVALSRPPDDSLEVFVVGRQWMWKLQHLSGRREINELHVPVGRPVKLTMTSEDVIHSFFIPAFRVKADVLPGRYTNLWFEATKEGVYHLFCAEFCGTEHSRMIGRIVAMPSAEYQQWLTGAPVAAGLGGGAVRGEALSMAAMGEQLFDRNGCRTCHATSPGEGPTATAGPPLYGLFGRSVEIEAGYAAVAEEEYLRRSILDPMAEIVRGYRPMMPTYAGRLSEEEVLRLVAYIKSLAAEHRPEAGVGALDDAVPAAPDAPAPPGPPGATKRPAGEEPWAPAPGESPPAEIPAPGRDRAKPDEDS